jgi:DegV family protein with EDD domain
MSIVRIITDSTAKLDSGFITQHQITVLPVEYQYGDERFLLDIDDSPDELFQLMSDGPAKPTRASVPVEVFQEAYSRLNREAEEILVIPSSSLLSETFSAAQEAAGSFLGRCRIAVMDSMTASKGLGLVVQAAAAAAAEGNTLDQIVRLMRGMLPHIYLVFFVDRLDYLEVKGRIDSAQAILGTMLRIKPLLLVEDGEIIPLEKVRTNLMAIEKLADFVDEFASVEQVTILRGPQMDGSGDLIEGLKELLQMVLPHQEFPVIEYGPLLACHLGPSALGVVVYEGD